MDAIEAIHGRRSIRHFRDDPTPRAIFEAAIFDAACAPYTPISRPKPWIFTVIEGKERIAAYGERALAYAREHRPVREGYAWADDPSFSVFHGAPTVIVISGSSINPLALEECTRAGQILALSMHARGPASCWVGSPNLWVRNPNVRAELEIADGYTPYAVFAIGFPAAPLSASPSAIVPQITWVAPVTRSNGDQFIV